MPFRELTTVPRWTNHKGSVTCVVAVLVNDRTEAVYETRMLFEGTQFYARAHSTHQAAIEDADWLRERPTTGT